MPTSVEFARALIVVAMRNRVRHRPARSELPKLSSAGEPRLSDAARARGVEADRGGGGEVEALGAAVDRDRGPGGRPARRARRAGPTPRCRTARRSGRPSSPSSRRRRGRARPRRRRRGRCSPAACAAADDRRPGRRLDGERQVEQAADRGPDGLGVVGVDAVRRRARRRRRPAASAQRITVPALPGSRTSAQTATSAGVPRSSTSVERDVEEAADARPRPAGCTRVG